MEQSKFLIEHEGNGRVGMVSGSGAGTAAKAAIETFEATGGTEVFAVLGGMLTVDNEVSDGGLKVCA